MRIVAHVSDVHFGTAEPRIVEALVDRLAALAPHVVAVSGDLTQRARSWQFREARAFLAALPAPQIVVPGNHDVPLYDVLRRFGNPLGRFRRHVTRDLHPSYVDREIAVFGANTTRSFTIKDGGFRRTDLLRIDARARELGAGVVKIVVCHHPFDPPTGAAGRLTRPRAVPEAVTRLVDSGIDIFLTGHLHVARAGETVVRYQHAGRSALVVEAGTAASHRRRGEPNSFNVLRLDGCRATVERVAWNPDAGRFAMAHRDVFVRTDDGWRAEPARI